MKPIKKASKILLTIAVFTFGLALGFGALWGAEKLTAQNTVADVTSTASTATPAATQSILPTPQKILTKEQFEAIKDDNDMKQGIETAPITIIEFSDFQCLYCKNFFDSAFGLLKTTYIDTGKVKLIYKNFPLTSKHPQALLAAEAVTCAAEQDNDKAWQMYDTIFTGDAEWNGKDTAADTFATYAEQSGLDKEAFTTCLTNETTKDTVIADFNAGKTAGILATPSFIIMKDGDDVARLYKGALSFVKLQTILSNLLQ